MYISKNKGFTLAELVLAMAIVSILTAAMVPMLKYHKVRPREKFTPHGIIECYYEGTTLKMFRKDNDKYLKGDTATLSSDNCEIAVPKANYYELHVIGAGGNGGGTNENGTAYNNFFDKTYLEASSQSSKLIYLNTDFSAEDSGLPSFVVDLWKKSGKDAKCKFELQTFVGSGNYTIPKKTGYDVTTGGLEDHYDYISYGSGTTGSKGTVDLQVKYNTKIDTAEFPNLTTSYQPVLKVDGKTLLQIKATVPTGGDSVSTYECNGGAYNSSCGNDISLSGSGTIKRVQTGSNQKTSTSSNYGVGNITFTYPEVDLHYTYGLAGKSGEYSVTYYEKIKAERLVLHPAKDASDNSTVGLKHPKNSTLDTLFKTKKKFEEETAEETIEDVTDADLPVPEKFKSSYLTETVPDDDNDYIVFCSKEPENQGMCHTITALSEEDRKNIIPGMGGYGGYPLILKPKDKNGNELNLKVTMKGNADSERDISGKSSLKASGASVCNKGTPTTGKNGNNVCKGTKGNPGAIILLW